ncbi:MAG: hypothetical protein LBC83_06685 [Oscillospiraceae bacterium]|jgi:hypothetical protein|nr:hypothetical protein [Oscillospiraceae bacterium]
MSPVLAFTVVMLIWTVSDFVSKKTKSILSSLFVASLIFLAGFLTNLFPEDMLSASSLLPFGTTIVGFVIVHLGTMMSLRDIKKQWKTFVIGLFAIAGVVGALFLFGPLFEDRNYIVAAIAAISGGTISIVMVQEAALAAGLVTVAILPVLIAAFQGLIGFPLASLLLRREAKRVKAEHRTSQAAAKEQTKQAAEDDKESQGKRPQALQGTAGTLFAVGLVVVISMFLSDLTGGIVNTFVLALVFGVVLRSTGIFKKNILSGIDVYGIFMLAILIIIFGPLARISLTDLTAMIIPVILSFLIGICGSLIFAIIAGKIMGYSLAMSAAIGLTILFGFPGTMILSQEAAKSAGESEAEVKAIEDSILPKMVVAGFSTVTITSVFVTSLLVGLIG